MDLTLKPPGTREATDNSEKGGFLSRNNSSSIISVKQMNNSVDAKAIEQNVSEHENPLEAW